MNLQNKTAQLLDYINQAGAKHADVIAINSMDESVHVRHGKVESIEAERAQGIGLRGFVETHKGLAFASASSSDLSESGLKALARQVVEMARISEPDPDAVPPVGANHPDASAIQAWQDKHPHTAHGWDTEAAKQAALACEAVAIEHQNVQNSEGANASFSDNEQVYASSDGFIARNYKSSVSLSVSVIAGEHEGMQRDYAWHSALSAKGLRSPESIGREAASRAVARLGSKGIASRTCPVIFEPRIATSLVRHFLSAINGRAVLQKQTFLADAVGEQLFPSFARIEENPDHVHGMANRLCDGEGTICQQRNLIEEGKLTSFLTDRYAAKRLNMEETGNASRGLTGDIGIGTSNIILSGIGAAHVCSPDDIYHDIQHGFLVTELMGFGINGVTGDYSRGAAGFLIEDGKITRPVHEITIAGNLKDMFANITHLGNDVTWFGSTAVPSIAISGMTIAGQ